MKKNDERFKSVVRGTKKFTSDEILQFLHESGKVDLSYVQEEIKMQDRKKLMAMHPYKITQGKDGYWRTYLPDKTQKSGRRQLKKKNQKSIENEVIAFYRTKTENPTIREVFDEWNNRRYNLKKIAASTHERNAHVR